MPVINPVGDYLIQIYYSREEDRMPKHTWYPQTGRHYDQLPSHQNLVNEKHFYFFFFFTETI